MKSFIFIIICLCSLSLNAEDSPQIKIANLQAQVDSLKAQLAAKGSKCQVSFEPLGYYLNLCPGGAVVDRVTILSGSTSVQLRCSQMRINCE